MSVKNRGFASFDAQKRREIASMGGKIAHQRGTAHQWTGGPDGTAASAGRKGGQISRGGRGKLVQTVARELPGTDATNGELSGHD